MTDARMVATNTHRRWLAVQSAAPRADRMTCSSHGLALGLIKTRCLPVQSLHLTILLERSVSLPWSHAAKQASDGRLASASRSIPSAPGPWARCLSLLFHCWMLAIPARAHSDGKPANYSIGSITSTSALTVSFSGRPGRCTMGGTIIYRVNTRDCGQLATQGFLNENGRPFAAASVRSMIE